MYVYFHIYTYIFTTSIFSGSFSINNQNIDTIYEMLPGLEVEFGGR
jgi:hypothetical protein